MPSKTRMLKLVKDLDWKAIRDDLAEAPKPKGFRDERGRNWIHLACMVNVKERKQKSSDQVKAVRVLLDAGSA